MSKDWRDCDLSSIHEWNESDGRWAEEWRKVDQCMKLCHTIGKIEKAMKNCKKIGGPFGPFQKEWNAKRRSLQARYQWTHACLDEKEEDYVKEIARILGYLGEE